MTVVPFLIVSAAGENILFSILTCITDDNWELELTLVLLMPLLAELLLECVVELELKFMLECDDEPCSCFTAA